MGRVEADAHIDALMREAGIDFDSMSDSSSQLESDIDEEGEQIEINQIIEEMKRVCSVATLQQEKVMIINMLPKYAEDIGTKRAIEHIV